jgi:hypothetical protein
LYDLSSDLIVLGILIRECHFCWGRCSPFGSYGPGSPYLHRSDTDLTQAAKDVIASQDALIDIFGRIGTFFRRLESYTEVPVTSAMEDMAGRIIVEVLGIFTIVTREIKQGRASESIRDSTFLVANKRSEKFFKKLIGRRDIEDALSRLDKLTQEEARMATAQVLKLAHDIEYSVETVGDKWRDKVMSVYDGVKSVDERVMAVIDGMFISLGPIKLPF